jgi:guanyl-specific ribonuclease Sa
MNWRAAICLFFGLWLSLAPNPCPGFLSHSSTEKIAGSESLAAESAPPLPSSHSITGATNPASDASLLSQQKIPARAQAILKAIQKRDGEPPPGYTGGRTFFNRERRLPRGHYREYDVNPRQGRKNRGAERIVIDQLTGKAYYTRDHYRTFLPMN